jgi:K+-transporting ATPase A subunit
LRAIGPASTGSPHKGTPKTATKQGLRCATFVIFLVAFVIFLVAFVLIFAVLTFLSVLVLAPFAQALSSHMLG